MENKGYKPVYLLIPIVNEGYCAEVVASPKWLYICQALFQDEFMHMVSFSCEEACGSDKGEINFKSDKSD